MKRRQLISSLALLVGSLSGWMQPSYAEGSKEMTASGGDRPFLEYRTASSTGIQRRSLIKVYADVGETINLGSSAVGLGSGIINYRRPDNSSGTCSLVGVIASRAQEVAGPLPNLGGYTPCIVTVGAGQSGVWEIDFVSPSTGSAADPTPIAATSNWTQPNNVGYVAAWDVTVRSASGTAIPGRVFTNYLALNVGSNGRSLSSAFTILTQDGYQYSIDLNGMDPFGFIFFSNNRGFKSSSGNPIFRSLQFTGGNPGSIPPSYSFQNPNNSDTSIDITHKIFFNPPDSFMPSSASSPTGLSWLYQLPTAPPTPTGFTFTGIEGTGGKAGTTPLGGNFTFNTNSIGSFTITLDLNQDGIYGNGVDRTFLGTTVIGTNTLFWNGRDSNGAIVPASSIAYGAKVVLYAGEAHFPFLDDETNTNGIIIRRLNDPIPLTTPNPDPYFVYYDDRNSGSSGTDYSICAQGETGASCYGTSLSPRSALNGISSSAGARGFSVDFGNIRGMDTWVYYPSQAVALSGGILIQQADLAITKTDNLTTIAPGSPTTYTITVVNNGPSNVVGARVTDTLPATITGVSWTCAVTAGTGACGAANGSGNAIDTTVNLNSGATITYTVTGTVSPAATGTITNTATITRPNDVTDPNTANNTATDTTTIVPAPDLTITKTHTGNFNQGQVGASYTLTVNNVGSADTSGTVTVTDTLPTGLTATAVSGTGWTCSITGGGTGVTCSRNNALVAGSSYPPITLTVNVAANAPSSVTNTANVSGGGETVTGNNTATDPTTITVINAAPNLRLVKRATAIRGVTRSEYIDVTSGTEAADDNAPNWPNKTQTATQAPGPGSTANFSGLLQGVVDSASLPAGSQPKPGDQVEYTIYFLSDGGKDAANVKLCDFIPENSTYVPGSLQLNLGGATTTLTDVPDGDPGTFFANPGPFPAVCGSAAGHSKGSVVADIGTVVRSTGSGVPAASSGFIRFRARVN